MSSRGERHSYCHAFLGPNRNSLNFCVYRIYAVHRRGKFLDVWWCQNQCAQNDCAAVQFKFTDSVCSCNIPTLIKNKSHYKEMHIKSVGNYWCHIDLNNDDSSNKHVTKFLTAVFSLQQSNILTAFLMGRCNKTGSESDDDNNYPTAVCRKRLLPEQQITCWKISKSSPCLPT